MLMMPGLYFDVEGKAAEMMLADSSLVQSAAVEQAGFFFAPLAMRISFLTVGIWWFGFALITFFSLKDVRPEVKPTRLLAKGFEELGLVMRKLRELGKLKRFLLAFAFYNMALQTVMYLATSFGQLELKMESGQLIISVLLIQLVAIPGSFLFAKLSAMYGNYQALMMGVTVWIGVCVGAYFVTDAMGFYVVGGVVGLLMGGMQALSRSTYSKLIPEGHDNASFFSFYSITDKISVVVGTLSFGVISQLWGTRNSVIALTVFFTIGGLLLWQLARERKTQNE
jgi:MFS transporter, UMF1 family